MLHLVSMVCQTNYKKLFKLYAVNLHNFFYMVQVYSFQNEVTFCQPS